ncbi:isoflavonoid 7-O-beta-apiosyl-glucoside beta-glycosidase-like [Gastrolobium bilobum]|uniref:isoflavonoid 7-O-beta-apiosyl-glucoside beta-glycosidase-like n=1 Tax=Gastrolobium bilobum TaxID=150636 RepID=UPI002AB14DCF|nr:isoflavonoid 7-O-beta-apiosyl-glucoside beta-glycosidase-like [Gastrolobium bilobum]
MMLSDALFYWDPGGFLLIHNDLLFLPFLCVVDVVVPRCQIDIVKAVMGLTNAEIERGYAMDVVASRQELLMNLSVALCRLQGVGESKLVLDIGRTSLQHEDAKPYTYDLVLKKGSRVDGAELCPKPALEDEYGGWVSRNIIRDFTDYADVCFKEFGDRVLYWTTVNEPNVFATDQGNSPLQRFSSLFGTTNRTKGHSTSEPYLAVHHILLLHFLAVRLCRRKYRAEHGFVGISVNVSGFLPLTNIEGNNEATQGARDFVVGWIMDPLFHGDSPNSMKTNADNIDALKTKLRDYSADMVAQLLFASGCPGLEMINTSCCTSITDSTLMSLSKCSNLKTLENCGCLVTSLGLAAIAMNCKQPRRLNIKKCYNFDDSGMLPLAHFSQNLRQINLSHSSVIYMGLLSLASINGLQSFTMLHLQGFLLGGLAATLLACGGLTTAKLHLSLRSLLPEMLIRHVEVHGCVFEWRDKVFQKKKKYAAYVK